MENSIAMMNGFCLGGSEWRSGGMEEIMTKGTTTTTIVEKEGEE